MSELETRPATEEDVLLILAFVRELAEYELLSHEVVATEEGFREWLFGDRPVAEVLLGYSGGEPAGFALFFHNFSTFLGRPGIYLEDLYVSPEFRGSGVGKALLRRLAELARERGCGPPGVVSVEVERAGNRVLRVSRRVPHGRLDRVPRDRREFAESRGWRLIHPPDTLKSIVTLA